MQNAVFLVVLSLLLTSLNAFGQSLVQAVGEVGHGPLSEISGIARSETYSDTFWVHNDSGDQPRLFAIQSDGAVLFPHYVDQKLIAEGNSDEHWPGLPVYVAANQDWEDIAINDGLIYIADVGNNGNMRRDLGLYVVREPNPRATTNARTFKYLPLQYPDQKRFPADQWHFDSESLFIDDGTAYFITKHRQPGKISDWQAGAKLYRLDSQYTDQINELALVESNDDIAIATGADLSPDGQWLAVICYTDIWLFERPKSGDRWLSSIRHRLPLDFKQTGQVEAIAWKNNNELLFTNEPGQLFSVKKQAIIEQSEVAMD